MFRQILLLLALALPGQAAGLLATFQQGGKTDAIVLPNAAFFVEAGQAATRFLDGGALTAELSGSISVDLRAQYAFQMEVEGEAELLVNGTSILKSAGTGLSELSRRVRLSKGTNALLVKVTGPANANTRFRLFWKSRDMALAVPIPPEALNFNGGDPVLFRQAQLRAGADAFAHYQCSHCHGSGESQPKAPDLAAAGARLGRDWMADWIADPARLRADARMPRLVAREEAEAIADFLAAQGAPSTSSGTGDARAGEKLFADLQCSKCHRDDGKTVLNEVSRKFQPGALAKYLLNPQAHYAWNPMPNFKLSEVEAANLAAFLAPGRTGASPVPAGASPAETKALRQSPFSPTDRRRGSPGGAPSGTGEAPVLPKVPTTGDDRIERGRELFEAAGCLNCHTGPGQNRFTATPIENFAAGCLDEANTEAPRFALDPPTRSALETFLERNLAPPAVRPSPIEFALSETAALNCAGCHNSSDAVIRLEALGGKLRPEWIAKFLRGDLPYKPRPWLAARMPAFPSHAAELAAGLAALHGLPPRSPDEKPINPNLAETGARLVSAAGGFSCVACHAVGPHSGALVVESPGINLAYSGERLLPSFFHRWLMNPLALDPATKMPVYFDDSGRSQLFEIFEGDGERQIEAMWHYVRLGDRMPAPPTP